MTVDFPELTILGLMSGTSMDGIDGCVANIQFSQAHSKIALEGFEILETGSLDYPSDLKCRLLEAVNNQSVSLQTLCELERDVGNTFGGLAKTLCEQAATNGHPVEAIASHGQTIYHVPPQGNTKGYSLQIGAPDWIADMTQCPVIADFRPSDMALGGQGAPLVPFVDQLLYQDPSDWIAVQNLGGISNVTIISPISASTKPTFAFDTGPANALIDLLCQAHFNTPFDKDGTFATQGHVDQALLKILLSEPYFQLAPPKSTGRELFGQRFIDTHFKTSGLSPHDQIRTATELTARSIQAAYQTHIISKAPVKTVIMSGGGTQNAFLMSRLTTLLKDVGVEILPQSASKLPSQSKEAFAFAVLGAARLLDLPNTLPQCTGAQTAVSAGAIWRKDLISKTLAAKIHSALAIG